MILEKIVESRKKSLEIEKRQTDMNQIVEKTKKLGKKSGPSFYEAIASKDRVSIIAEIKRASPSRGDLNSALDPSKLSMEYTKAGVDAISVLTEEDYFKGNIRDLALVRQATTLPILRKDFIIDMWQVYQSRLAGADAILLIAAILEDLEMARFGITAGILGMDVVYEVHNKEELSRVLSLKPKIIGINNRDLRTFETNLETTGKLINLIPSDKTVVSESGIKSGDDIRKLKNMGANAVLVGESLVVSKNVTALIKEMEACS